LTKPNQIEPKPKPTIKSQTVIEEKLFSNPKVVYAVASPSLLSISLYP